MKGTETITRVRATGTPNRHGERTGKQRDDIEKCLVWPRTSVETGEEIVIDGYNVFVPPTDIAIETTASDKFECRGETWDVIGTPGDYRKRGRRKGFLLTLGKVRTAT